MRSKEAMSNAASADWPCSPGRPYSRRSIAQASRSVSNGSAPIDVPAGELLDDRDERVGLVDRPDLADAGQPGVGLELDEDELAPRCPDDRRPDVGDLHVASSGWADGARCGAARSLGARHLTGGSGYQAVAD